MITVQELLQYATETDMSLTAHSLYWAITEKKIALHDDSEKLKSLSFDEVAIRKILQQNLLRIGEVKLFAMQTRQKNWYAFYFAKHSLDVHHLHETRFGETDGKVTQADRLLPNLMVFAESGKETSWFACRKSVQVCPAYMGHVLAGERVVYRM